MKANLSSQHAICASNPRIALFHKHANYFRRHQQGSINDK